MKLNKIKLNNIRSYEEEEIIFPEGSILLSGDIGSGKTSVLLGIEFALFGLQPGQKGSSLLRNGAKEGKVCMEFEINEKIIVVERTLKKGKTISQDSCSITIDGERKEISVTELKNRILTLLNYPKEFSKKQNLLYKFTVYTPQEEMKQIILQDSDTRINTLRHVFGIDKYKRVLENSAIVITKIREEKRIKEGMLMNFEQEKITLATKENELEKKKSDLILSENELVLRTEKRKKIQAEKEEISKRKEERVKLTQEAEKTKIMILNKQDIIAENFRMIEQLNVQIENLNKIQVSDLKIEELEQKINSKKTEKRKINEKNFEVNSRINALEIRIEEAKKMEKKFSALEVCPTCLQNVETIYRANVLNKNYNEISKNTSEIQELDIQKKQFCEILKKLDAEIFSGEKELTDLRILKVKQHEIYDKKLRKEDIEKNNIVLNKDAEMLRQHSESLVKSIGELGKVDLVFAEKQKEFEEASRLERLSEMNAVGIKKEIAMFSVQIKELKDKINRLEETRNKLNYLAQLEDWMTKNFIPLVSNVEKNVMAKLKTEFSNLFVEWFGMLVSEGFNVRLRDDFTPVVEQQDYELDYSYLSGGERTAIALAYRLALNQVINSLLSKIGTRDMVILDEPTDGFSEQQLDKMREVLDQLNVKQLIIVSHEQKIEGFVENVIKFRKDGGVSRKG
jgi:exonuclease SbcC